MAPADQQLVSGGHQGLLTRLTVRIWLDVHVEGVELRFFPAYSPGPKPGERVNTDCKHRLPRSHRDQNQTGIASGAQQSFRKSRCRLHIVHNCFHSSASAVPCSRCIKPAGRPSHGGR